MAAKEPGTSQCPIVGNQTARNGHPQKSGSTTPFAQKAAEVGMISGSRLSGSRNRNSNMNNEQDEAFEKVVVAVVRIIFGDDNLTDMNVRLVRIALERYGVPEIINSPAVA